LARKPQDRLLEKWQGIPGATWNLAVYDYGGLEMIGTVLLIVLLLILIGALPTWPYSRGVGYYPSGGIGLVLIIVVILLLSRVYLTGQSKADTNMRTRSL
jgi:hypothetical protein